MQSRITTKRIIWALLISCGLIFAFSAAISAGTKAETATIKLSYKGNSTLRLLNTEASEQLSITTNDGVIVLSPGTYQLLSFEAFAKTANGKEWTAWCSFIETSVVYLSWGLQKDNELFSGKKIILDPGSVYDLNVGPPFTASVSVRESDKDRVTMDLSLIGQGDKKYKVTPKDGKPSPPGFQVLDKSGKVVWKGSFAYG